MIKKIGIVVYHSDVSRYREEWIKKCIHSIYYKVTDPYVLYQYYELSYGPENKRLLPLSASFLHKPQANYAAAMNYSYQWAFGDGCDAVANVNIDDYYDKLRFDLLMDSLNDGADVASSNYILVDEDGKEIRRTDFAGLNLAEELNKGNNIVSNPGHMMKARVFEKLKFDPSLVPREDLQYWKDCLAAGFKIVIRPEHLHYYRIHAGQSGNVPITI